MRIGMGGNWNQNMIPTHLYSVEYQLRRHLFLIRRKFCLCSWTVARPLLDSLQGGRASARARAANGTVPYMLIISSYHHIGIYTALRHRTCNQTVKVSACEGIDRYTYTEVYIKPTIYNLKSITNNEINRMSEALQQTQQL